MTGEPDRFSVDWLSLREGADSRARATALTRGLGDRLRARTGARALTVLDLGAGAGNNLRYLAPLLGGPQRWRLVDADAALLARAAAAPPLGVTVETVQADLAQGLAPDLAHGLAPDFTQGRAPEVAPGLTHGLAPLLQPRPDLVTASALIDLCGAAWLDGLAASLAAAGLPALIVLSYDGRQAWDPPHADDTAVIEAFHADQRRDKGLGPALGPGAHAALAATLAERHGFEVTEAASDWDLRAATDGALIAALAEGTADAAAAALGPRAATWGRARRDAAAARVGHRDLLAWPPG
ncbi:MAG: SAM-dependent methyltransferase [Pseudomonadota bacterium]